MVFFEKEIIKIQNTQSFYSSWFLIPLKSCKLFKSLKKDETMMVLLVQIQLFDCRHLDILSINLFPSPQALQRAKNLIIIIKYIISQRASRRHIMICAIFMLFFIFLLLLFAFHTMPFNYIKNFAVIFPQMTHNNRLGFIYRTYGNTTRISISTAVLKIHIIWFVFLFFFLSHFPPFSSSFFLISHKKNEFIHIWQQRRQ